MTQISKKTAVLVYGRFQPLHYAHELMIRWGKEYAKQTGYDFYIFTTHTQDKKNNPLDYEQKRDILEQLFSDDFCVFPDSTITSIIDYMSPVYDEIHLIVGGDQETTFTKLFTKYKDDFDCEVKVIKFVDRNKYNISATKMREFAKNGNFESFIENCPKGISDKAKMKLYYDVAMKINGFVRNVYGKRKSTRPSKIALFE